jgi:hypothetical protein
LKIGEMMDGRAEIQLATPLARRYAQMSSKLIDRATKARNRKAPAQDAKAPEVEASPEPASNAEFEAEVAEAIANGVDPVTAEAEANALDDEDEDTADVIDISDAVVARMSEEEIEAFLAHLVWLSCG